jgi:hypothetical protein
MIPGGFHLTGGFFEKIIPRIVVHQLRMYLVGRAGWRSWAIAQTARVRVARQPDASAAAASVSRTVSKMSCSGQYWLAGW